MISADDKRPEAAMLRAYQEIVYSKHPKYIANWPLLNGWNITSGSFGDVGVYVFKDAGFTSFTMQNGVGELAPELLGVERITPENCDGVRARLERHFNIGKRDAIIFWPSTGLQAHEIEQMLLRHELAVGIASMKIFLSHKGSDKRMVREFKSALELLGFDPWLDEDAMPAGTSLERGISKGFVDSCAAVFFVTPEFKDESYLATEVEYAIREKRTKGNRFSIITLVFGDGEAKGSVPELLHGYVWKEPKTQLEALQEIVKALPIQVGTISWR